MLRNLCGCWSAHDHLISSPRCRKLEQNCRHNQPAVQHVGCGWLKREGLGYSCYIFAVLTDMESQDYRGQTEQFGCTYVLSSYDNGLREARDVHVYF